MTSTSSRTRPSARGSSGSPPSPGTFRSTRRPVPVRVRFAPSPTGSLHLGNALTAVANRRFADANGGVLVLRIDDTDPTRTVAGGEDAILGDLAWLDVAFDEGPVRQSDRGAVYSAAAARALESGGAEHDEDGSVRLARSGTTLLRADGTRDLPARLRRRRSRARHHARDPRIGPPAERRGAAAHRACARRRAARGDPPRARPRARTGRSSRSGTGTPRSRSFARRAFLPRPCAPISTSSISPSTTSSSISLVCAGSQSMRSPPCRTRSSRPQPRRPSRSFPRFAGRASLVEAREYARLVLDPQLPALGEDARPTLERFGELRAPAPERLSLDEGKAIVRELKAVGGDLHVSAPRADGRRSRPGARCRARRAFARRGARTYHLTTIGAVRLYDTLTRSLVELPPPPGPIRMYVCGSTVYQRVHVGNARPFVLRHVASQLAARDGLRGDARPQHHRRQRQDLRRGRTPRDRERASSPRGRPSGSSRTRTISASGGPTSSRRATETIPEIVAFIGELVERGRAYESDGDVYFSVAAAPEYGRLSGARLEDMVSQESSALKRDQRDFALWKAQKPHEDAVVGLAVGSQVDRAGTSSAPRWSEKHLGPEFEIHGGGLDLRVPAPRERARAVARARAPLRARLDAQRHARARRREDVEVAGQRRHAARRRSTRWGRETLLVFFLTGHWRKPLDFSDETLESAAARADGFREVFRNPSEPAPADAWERFAAALDDDFNTPAALAVLHEWRDHELLRRALGHLRARVARSRRRGAGRGRRARRGSALRHGPRATSTRPIAFEPRSRRPAGTCATRPTASASSAPMTLTRELVYGRNAVRELLPRAAAGARDLGRRSARPPQIPWLDAGPRPQVKPERLLSEAAGTRDHQGVVAWCEPYPLRRRLRARQA